MLLLFLGAMVCADLSEGEKTISPSHKPETKLSVKNDRVVYGEKEQKVNFVKIKGNVYDIKFGKHSVCSNFFGENLMTCKKSKWEVIPDGPYYKIATPKKDKKSQKCWRAIGIMGFKRLHLRECSNEDRVRFSINDANKPPYVDGSKKPPKDESTSDRDLPSGSDSKAPKKPEKSESSESDDKGKYGPPGQCGPNQSRCVTITRRLSNPPSYCNIALPPGGRMVPPYPMGPSQQVSNCQAVLGLPPY
jgi:hypothetical protein